jgi:hypothetical protein
MTASHAISRTLPCSPRGLLQIAMPAPQLEISRDLIGYKLRLKHLCLPLSLSHGICDDYWRKQDDRHISINVEASASTTRASY